MSRRTSHSGIQAVLDRSVVQDLLAPLVADAQERAFVVRLLLEEGPVHHRASSYALILLVAEIVRRLGAAPAPVADGAAVPIPLRLPPHLQVAGDQRSYPLALDASVLDQLPLAADAREALVDCLSDGPPHHALANALLVSLLGAALAKLPRQGTDRA